MVERIEAVFLQRPFKVMALVEFRILRVEPRDKMVKVYIVLVAECLYKYCHHHFVLRHAIFCRQKAYLFIH